MRGAKLRERRLALGLTQQALADKLEVTQNTVARWERDEMANPGFLHLALSGLSTKPRRAQAKAKQKEKPANTICYEPATRILVADHDDDNRCLVKTVLSMKGFEVLQALNGEEAFTLMGSGSTTLPDTPAHLYLHNRMHSTLGLRPPENH